MNPQAFFVRWRDEFGKLDQEEVDGINALLAEMEARKWEDPRWWAYALATVWHETGGMMRPIKETVAASHKDKNPSDATVIKRLDAAFAKGQLPWVKTPYWREGWFGRGFVQITHKINYESLGRRLGIDLVGNRDLALDPAIAAAILCEGMEHGLFTGMGLGAYFGPHVDDPVRARRIVNGNDRAEQIAGYYEKALAAVEAGWPVKEDDELRAEIAALKARIADLEQWATAVSAAFSRRTA